MKKPPKKKNPAESKTLREIGREWVTGPDGVTHDPARFLWFLGIVVFLVFTGHQVYESDKFDMVNFAMAYGTLLAAGAAGVKIKESTEPKEIQLRRHNDDDDDDDIQVRPRPRPKTTTTVVVKTDEEHIDDMDDNDPSLRPPRK